MACECSGKSKRGTRSSLDPSTVDTADTFERNISTLMFSYVLGLPTQNVLQRSAHSHPGKVPPTLDLQNGQPASTIGNDYGKDAEHAERERTANVKETPRHGCSPYRGARERNSSRSRPGTATTSHIERFRAIIASVIVISELPCPVSATHGPHCQSEA